MERREHMEHVHESRWALSLSSCRPHPRLGAVPQMLRPREGCDVLDLGASAPSPPPRSAPSEWPASSASPLCRHLHRLHHPFAATCTACAASRGLCHLCANLATSRNALQLAATAALRCACISLPLARRSATQRQRPWPLHCATCMHARTCRRGRRAEGGGQLEDLELDPCDVCHSTLPPLLLSIVATCPDCGQELPCLGALQGGGAGQKV